ncbi:hypothetical protein GGP44_000151 [Salinibacter ruber]|nr:hypothetical protein [Salinibacter ruber]
MEGEQITSEATETSPNTNQKLLVGSVITGAMSALAYSAGESSENLILVTSGTLGMVAAAGMVLAIAHNLLGQIGD